jgi:hypothetical protein
MGVGRGEHWTLSAGALRAGVVRSLDRELEEKLMFKQSSCSATLSAAIVISSMSCGSPAAQNSEAWNAAGSSAQASASTSQAPGKATSSASAPSGRAPATPSAQGVPSAQAGASSPAPAAGSPAPAASASSTNANPPVAGAEAAPVVCPDPDNAFAIIQERIFDQHSCSAAACHGNAAIGGLSLASDKAYDSLVNIQSSVSDLQRVKPGAPDESFMYQKLRAATEPGSVSISGSPMPSGLPPLSADELKAVGAWIAAGAPATGPVAAPDGAAMGGNFVANMLCQGTATAQAAEKPKLEPPEASQGIQFKMPASEVPAGGEWEGCFATYYDVSAQVPDEFKSPDGASFYVSATAMRFTAGTHHTAATLPKITVDSLTDPAFGAWTCRGGDTAGATCDPANTTACGEGMCASTPQIVPGCIGYGPAGTDVNSAGFGLVQALNADAEVAPIAGVYREVPTKGVVFWDFHGVNLQDETRAMDGRINMTYASDRKQLERRVQINGGLDGDAAVPPFKKQRLCNIYTAPKGTEIIRMTSHTHHRATNFRVWGPDGAELYESHSYSEPAYITFQPSLKLDAEAEQDRQLKFCADFNNGVGADGGPDLDTLCQVSKTPDYELFLFVPTAVACSEGKWGEPCTGGAGDAQCDTSAGAGDGKCDAANIHYSTTTAGEMFLMSLDTVIRPEDAQEENLFTSYIWAEPLPNQDL